MSDGIIIEGVKYKDCEHSLVAGWIKRNDDYIVECLYIINGDVYDKNRIRITGDGTYDNKLYSDCAGNIVASFQKGNYLIKIDGVY